MVWQQLHWPQPLDPTSALAALRALAADSRSPRLILEARADDLGVDFSVGTAPTAAPTVTRRLRTAVPEVRVTVAADDRVAVHIARRLRMSTRHRPLRTEPPDASARSVLGALTAVKAGELLVLQLVLGPRRVPLAVPNRSPSSVVMPWYQLAWSGNGGQVDGEKRSALRAKVADHGFAASIRLGVVAPSASRRQTLMLGLYNALRVTEGPGVSIKVVHESASKVDRGSAPRFWPLRLGASEVLALCGWPVGAEPLPGQPPAHPKRLPPAPGTTGEQRVVGVATAPGVNASLQLPAEAARHHLHLLSPTGGGKSTLMTNLICADAADGQAIVVVDPQGDLVTDVLARIPQHRRDDVVVLDPSDTTAPVGLNPLLTRGRNPETVADTLLAVFTGLYGESLGPRSQDILHSCLLTLTQRDDASLVMLPLLLTNQGFRRSLTHNLRDPIALGPFWDWYEHLSEGERHAAIAPIQNKLRQWLLRPSLRNVLAQRNPKISMSEVFRDRRILLVSLAAGRQGPACAALLGALVVAELWQATTERSLMPADRRQPVMVYLDEFSAFMHLPTDLADALARSRGMGVGYTLAHQYLGQLSPAMRNAVLTNCRSRICWQLTSDDANVIARNHPELSAEDLTSLGRFEVYASLFANGQVTPFTSARTHPAPQPIASPQQLRDLSHARYGQPLDKIAAEFAELVQPGLPTADATPGRSPRRRT